MQMILIIITFAIKRGIRIFNRSSVYLHETWFSLPSWFTNYLVNTISKIIFYIIRITYKLFFYFVVSINFKINGEYCYNENVRKMESRKFYFSTNSKIYCNYYTVISWKNCHRARFAFLFWTSWEIPEERNIDQRNVQIYFLRKIRIIPTNFDHYLPINLFHLQWQLFTDLFISDNGDIYIFTFLSAKMQLFQVNRNRPNFVLNFTTYCLIIKSSRESGAVTMFWETGHICVFFRRVIIQVLLSYLVRIENFLVDFLI